MAGDEETAAALRRLEDRIDRLALQMEKTGIAEYVEMLRRPRYLLFTNLLLGVARGIGTAIGFALFGALAIYVLQRLLLLNLPVIGGLIANVIRIVQQRLELPY